MKNLDNHVVEIGEQKCPLKKRELIQQMIDYSDADKKTKIKWTVKLPFIPDYKLDQFANNYRLRGLGLGVI